MTYIFGHTVVAMCGGHLPAAQMVRILSIFQGIPLLLCAMEMNVCLLAAQTARIMPDFLLGICNERCLYRDPAGFAVWSDSLVV